MARIEDARLVSGTGRYADDERAPGQLHGVFVRSPHAFADLRGLDTAAAAAAPGVAAVLTAADLVDVGNIARVAPVPGRGGKPLIVPHRPALVGDTVRHVGDAVALVVAETEAAALDAAELVAVEYEPRAAVADVVRAVEPDAPQLWPEAPGNVAVDWVAPGSDEAIGAVFDAAAHVATLRLVNQRIVVASMEPRGALAFWDAAADRYTLEAGSQSAAVLQTQLSQAIGLPREKLRVVSRDVGGAFGMKTPAYPEYAALLVAAKRTGRPVKWRSTRSEAFVTDNQARDWVIDAALALDADGRFLGLEIQALAALGAYQSSHAAFISTFNFARCLPCMYDIKRIAVGVRCVFTNTVPTGPYRGAGRPEANYVVERLVDAAARQMALDPVELRRRNFIKPAQLPYKSPMGVTFDSGDFAGILDAALARADAAGFPARRAASKKPRGLGVSCFLEIAGGQPGEGAAIGFPGGSKLLLAIGVQASGQGHATIFRRLIAQRLGIPEAQVEVAQGDTEHGVASAGAVASRSTMSVGGAVVKAVETLLAKAKPLAASALEVAEADIAYRDGAFEVVGTDRRIALFELAERERLDTRETADVPPAFPNGCHVAEVEIDPETGVVELLAYTAVDDCGTVLDEILVDGQVQGGVAQGVGQALMESGVYDRESGQLLAASFNDYEMPRADRLPPIRTALRPTRCATNALGVKGVGEAGTTAALAAIMNALADAGVEIDMPATPLRVWQALHKT